MVVDKEYDLVINCDDPKRPSVAKQLEEKFPLLADPNLQHAFRFVNRCGHSHKLFFQQILISSIPPSNSLVSVSGP